MLYNMKKLIRRFLEDTGDLSGIAFKLHDFGFRGVSSVESAAVGGAAALISRRIVSSEILAYEDLGPEAIRRLQVKDFPVIVVNDTQGNDLYEQGVKEYAIK